MCGLAAIFAYRPDAPPVDALELDALSRALARRGPDGAGRWIEPEGRLGLAHRRLSIIDLSAAANQPMILAGDDLHIVYNGEIYNYRALREDLKARGRILTTHSDTEVLLHLYAVHGPSMVDHLRGMYAFALWDGRRRGLFLARDPFGIKPLYYADDGRSFRVASQVKALRAGGHAGTGVDPAGHAGFFLFGHVPEPHTLFADIHTLPAGHTLWVDDHGPRTPKSFFDLGGELAGAEKTLFRNRPAIDLRDTLLDSLRHHLVADVPVGIFLSAGLDSAAVTGLAAEIHGGPIETVTLAFDEFADTTRDEAPLAEAVAHTYGTRHMTRRVAGSDFRHDLDDVLTAMDQPTIDGVNVYFVAKAAAEAGLKVALSGLGGDEIFGGYDSFRQIPRLVGLCGRIPGLAILGRALRVLSAPAVARIASPKIAGFLEYGTRYGDAYLLRRGLFMPWELPRILGDDLAREGWRALAPCTRLEETARPIMNGRCKVAALEMAFYMRNQLLRDADWAGMAHGLEIRLPFVDVSLLRTLAPWLGQPGGPDKQAMAATPATPLPPEVLTRPKTGFSVPVRDWLMGKDAPPAERGLRGWARRVYAAACNET